MKKLVLFIGILAVVSSAQAGVVAGWEIDGVDVDNGIQLDAPGTPYAFSATTSETAHVTAKLTLGEGVLPSTAVNKYGFKISASDATNSLVGAISQNHYMEFSIEIADGYALNLDSLEIKGGGTATGCSNVVLMTSVDGFIAGQEISSANSANEADGIDTDPTGFGAPIDLSGVQYSNLTGAISFRLYGWNSTSGSGSTFIRSLGGEDLVVYGDVVAMPPGDGVPSLALVSSNGASYVTVEFDGAATTNYVLQSSTNMVSNIWNSVSVPFAANTNWNIETINDVGFYRVIPE
ncbi:MAG: hypothetical protein V3V05_01720 [Pontiella sp.]